MDRRAVLRRGLVVGCVGLAGCGFSTSDSVGSPDTDSGPESTDDSPASGIQTVFDRTISTPTGLGSFEDVTVLDSGAIVAVGTRSMENGNARGWAVRTDPQGTPVWQHTTESENTQFDAVSPAGDGEFLAIGRRVGAGDDQRTRGWVQRVAADGTARWAESYGSDGASLLKTGIQTSGGFLLAGVSSLDQGGGGRGWLVEIDDEGSLVDQWAFDSDFYRVFTDVVRTGADQYVLLGSASDERGLASRGYAVGLAEDRSVRFQNQYGPAQRNGLRGGAAVADGGVRACGEVSPNGAESAEDAWILGIGADGTRQWSTTQDEQGGNRLWDVAAGPDGSTLCVGQTNVTGRPTQAGVAIHVGADGTTRATKRLDEGSGSGLSVLSGVAHDSGTSFVACGVTGAGTTDSGTVQSSARLVKVSV